MVRLNFKRNRVSHGPLDGKLQHELIDIDNQNKQNKNQVPIHQKHHYSLGYILLIYGGLLLWYLLGFFIPYWTTSIPETKTIPNISSGIMGNFSVELAYRHLEVITKEPHQFNMAYNDKLHDYIYDYALDLSTKFPHVVLDQVTRNITFTNTPSSQFGTGNVTGYFEASNVVVKVKGTKSENALLISAHFDSVPLSYGANDNGMGVATTMEVLRLLANHPPTHDVIFNINNHEETGLLGSYSFSQHPWFHQVKAFINIDGSGAGGRVLLFQCSSPELVSLAKSLPNPNTSVLGNDLFQLNVLNSITDFAIYSTKLGIPGVDFAIYNNRAVYHTVLDDLDHAYLPTLANMGQSIWPMTQAILNSDYLDSNPKIHTAGIFYDVMGSTSINYSFTSDAILGITLNVVMLISFIFWLRSHHSLRLVILPIIRGFLSIVTGVILFVIMFHIFNIVIQKANLLIVHSQWVLVYFFNSFLSIQCYILSDMGWNYLERRMKSPLIKSEPHQRRSQVSMLAMGCFWFLGVLFQRVTSQNAIGLLYYLTWFGYSYFITYAISSWVDPINFYSQDPLPPRPYEKFLVGIQIIAMVLVPGLILQDSAKNVLISMSQSLTTGSAPYIVYFLVSFFSMTTTLPTIPFLVKCAHHHSKAQLILSVVTLSLFIAICCVNPLTAAAPMTFYWSQSYNITDRTSPVTVRGLTGLKDLAPRLVALSGQSGDYEFTPGTPFSMLQYSGLEPTFPVPPHHIINVTQLHSDLTSQEIVIDAYHTKQCRLLIPTSVSLTNLTVTTDRTPLPLNLTLTPPSHSLSSSSKSLEPPSYRIYLFRRHFINSPWHVHLHHAPLTTSTSTFPLQLTCYYDDYQPHIPALLPLLHNRPLPPTVTLSTGAHILEIHRHVSLPQSTRA